jgi:hypothetical protein
LSPVTSDNNDEILVSRQRQASGKQNQRDAKKRTVAWLNIGGFAPHQPPQSSPPPKRKNRTQAQLQKENSTRR